MEFHEFVVALIVCSVIFSSVAMISQADPVGTLATGSFVFTVVGNPSTTSTTTTTAISAPTFSCSGCNTGNCFCTIANCASGAFDFYSSAGCSILPYIENTFSNSRISFSISKNIYARIFCDDGTSSSCTAIAYSPGVSFSCSACNTGTCICMTSGCTKGTFDYYSNSDCSMSLTRKLVLLAEVFLFRFPNLFL